MSKQPRDRHWKLATVNLTLGLVLGIVLAACGSSSADSGNTSADGLTESEVNALIDAKVKDYETRIATLEAALETLSQSVNVVVASGSAAASKGAAPRSKTQLLADAEAIGCSFSGYLPENQLSADTIQCKTSAGYLFNLAWPEGGAPLAIGVYYEQPGCIGTPYAPKFMVEDGAREQGAIVTYFDAGGAHTGYIAAGSPVVTRTALSVHNGTSCTSGLNDMRDDLTEISPHVVDTQTDTDGDGLHDVTGGKNVYPAMTVQ